MKRLTSKRNWEEAKIDLKHEMGYSHIWKRLAEIENILGDDGDDYNLDRLKELVQADREERCVVHPLKSDDEVYIILLSRVFLFELVKSGQLPQAAGARACGLPLTTFRDKMKERDE